MVAFEIGFRRRKEEVDGTRFQNLFNEVNRLKKYLRGDVTRSYVWSYKMMYERISAMCLRDAIQSVPRWAPHALWQSDDLQWLQG